MRSWFFGLVMLGSTAFAQDSIPSPNGRYVAELSRNPTHGIGKQLFVRYACAHDSGRFLLANDRWLEAQWSPNSRFLAVTNHTDGHIADVLVFGIRGRGTAKPDAQLLFVSPSPGVYDTKWAVSGWDGPHRAIVLEKRVRGAKRQQIRFSIGTTPLQLP